MAKVVCFDFDDVLTEKDALARFAEVFGHTFKELEYGLELLEDNKDPKKFYRTMKKVIELGKGIKYERVEKITFFLKPTKNVKQTLRKLKVSGYKIVIVSTNDQNIIRKFLKIHKIDQYIDHIYASKLGVKNGLLTGVISGEVIKTEKCGVIGIIEKKYKAQKKDIFYVGDGMTDLPIIKKLGRGVLFCPNTIAEAEVFIDKDLSRMENNGKLFLVKEKNLEKVLDFID